MAAPRLLDQVRAAIRARHYSRRAEEAYVHWIRRFIVFHGRRHPRELGASEVSAFIMWLAVEQHLAGSTPNQALSGLLFDVLQGVPRLVVMLLYGAGLRLQGALELRVKDLDFERREITVRRGKGQKDRRVMLPDAVRAPLIAHLEAVNRVHQADLAAGFGRVMLPEALDRKYPDAATSWSWQFVFPAGRIRICRDERYGTPSRYRSFNARSMRLAVRWG